MLDNKILAFVLANYGNFSIYFMEFSSECNMYVLFGFCYSDLEILPLPNLGTAEF